MYYDGSYEAGLYHGVGELMEEDGSIYSGTWCMGARQGQGKQFNSRERHEYVGGFRENLYHGAGKCTWINGSIYEGDWVAGHPNGVGMYACFSLFAAFFLYQVTCAVTRYILQLCNCRWQSHPGQLRQRPCSGQRQPSLPERRRVQHPVFSACCCFDGAIAGTKESS